MAEICTIHAHSNPATAARCFFRRIGKRADKKLRGATPAKTRMVYHSPFRVADRSGIALYVFAEDANTSY